MALMEWALIASDFVLLPYALYLGAVAAAAISRRVGPGAPEGEPSSRFLILIPAHDEEGGIERTVASCLAGDYPASSFSVLVVADNCSDRTAEVAAGAGARVVERRDETRKSKGYAIEYLIGRLIESGEFDALDGIVVIDADTTIDPGLLRRFDAHLRAGHDWVQCYYTVANPDQSWRTRLMTYAFALINGVLPMGQAALGSSAGLKGNGMCFSTRGLRRRPWASYGLVEDMEFSWMLRLDGEKIAFEPGARVYGEMVSGGGPAAVGQRKRWEFGRREVRRKYLGPLLRSPRIGGWDRLISALELTVPTMGFVVTVAATLVAADAIAAVYPAPLDPPRWLPIACGSALVATLGLYAIAPFVALRLPVRYARSLALAPAYLAWKVIVRLGGRPEAWVRTPREAQPAGDARR